MLNLIRYYYIGFVKNRIVDKVNAYNGLLDTVVLTFDPKEDSTTEANVTEEPVKEEEPSKSEDSDPEVIEDDSTVESKEEPTEEEGK